MIYDDNSKMYQGFIYCVTNKVNGKQYIGKTARTIETRWNEHKKLYIKNKNNTYFYCAVNKYGVDNFEIEALYTCGSRDRCDLDNLLNKLEKECIAFYKTICPCGYNMTIGGEYGGNTFAEKPVSQYDIDGNLISQFHSISEASRKTGVDQSDISYCCMKKKIKTAGGYRWCYSNESIDLSITPTKNIRVCQYDLFGNLLNTYQSSVKAEAATGCNFANINACCRGRALSVKGFVWRYFGDDFDKYRIPNINNAKYKKYI